MIDTNEIMKRIDRMRDASGGAVKQAYFPVDEIEQIIFDMETLKADLNNANREVQAVKDSPTMVEMQVALALEGIDVAFGRDEKGQLKAFKVEATHKKGEMDVV